MTNKKNLSQVAQSLALELNLDPKATRVVLKCFLDMVKNDLHNGVAVTLTGFGSFKAQHKDAGRVRNPRIASGPGAFKDVEARTTFRFKPGTDLKPGATLQEKFELTSSELTGLARLK